MYILDLITVNSLAFPIFDLRIIVIVSRSHGSFQVTFPLQLFVHLFETNKLEDLAPGFLGVERWEPFRQGTVELTSGWHGNVPPHDSQHGSRKGHPHDTDRRRHTGGVVAKVKLGQEETKGGTLHGGLNGHGAGSDFAKASKTGQGVSNQSSDQVEEEDGNLQRETRGQDGFGDLCDGTGDQQAGGKDTDDGGKRKNLLDKLGEEFVGGHTNSNGSQDNLRNKTRNI